MPLTNRVAILVETTGPLDLPLPKPLPTRCPDRFGQQGGGRTCRALARAGLPESRVMTHVADALDETALQALAAQVQARFDHADILLHVAGAYRGASLRDTSNEVWDYLLNVNLRTAVNAMRTFVPLLVANNWGRILTISSGVTQTPPANAAAYVAAKSALEALTIAVAQEPELLKEKNVTANVLLIRALDTPAERAKQPDKRTGWVRPADVAATLLFLCSDEGGAITGARIPVSGGN